MDKGRKIHNYEFSFLALFPFYPYTISMLSFRTVLPQYRLSSPKARIPAYFQKVVDTHSFVGIITQQLRRKVCLRPEKRAAFSFRQQHHHFSSSTFAGGKSGVLFFHLRQSLRFVLSGLSCALDMQKPLHYKHIINTVFYRRSRPAVWFDSG